MPLLRGQSGTRRVDRQAQGRDKQGCANTPRRPPSARLISQFSAFAGVGLVAAVVHYGTLIGLVEGYRAGPVPATLAGYVLGGIVSYALNRRYAFRATGRTARRRGVSRWWRGWASC